MNSFFYSMSNYFSFYLLIMYLTVKRKKIFLPLVIVGFFYGMRDFSIGRDTKNYVSAYVWSQGGYFKEILFKSYGKILYALNCSPRIYIFLLSLILSGCIYVYIYKISIENKERSFLLWMMLFSSTAIIFYINILRQGIAIMIILISYYSKTNKNKLMYYILGCLIHYSSIFFLFINFKVLYRWYLKYKLRTEILLWGICLVFSKILYLFSKRLEDLENFQQHKSFYVKVALLIIVYIFFRLKKIKNKELFLLWYVLCITFLAFGVPVVSNRLLITTSFVTPILIYRSIKRKKILIIGVVLYHLFSILYPSIAGMLFK